MTNIDPQDPIDTRTTRQIAGAANGRLAAGAKSPEGLARSAANSTKHGLTAKMTAKTSAEMTVKTSPKSAADKPRNGVTILNECPDAFEDLFESLASCFLPTDAHEKILVKRTRQGISQAEWLRRRAVHMETAALSEAMRQQAHPLHANTGSQVLSKSEAEALRAWHGFSKLGNANPALANPARCQPPALCRRSRPCLCPSRTRTPRLSHRKSRIHSPSSAPARPPAHPHQPPPSPPQGRYPETERN